MAKSPDAFRTISEVAEWLGIQAHVLRFWESKFTQVKPIKRAGGRRYYRPADMLLLGGIKKLLHDDGLTIKGVQKILREEGMSHVSALSQPLDEEGQPAVAPEPVLPVAKPEEEKGVVLSFGGRAGEEDDIQTDKNTVTEKEVSQDASTVQDAIAGDTPEERAVEEPSAEADTPEPSTPAEDPVAADTSSAAKGSEPSTADPVEPEASEPATSAPETADAAPEDTPKDAGPTPEATEPEQASPVDAAEEASEPTNALPAFLRRPLVDPADSVAAPESEVAPAPPSSAPEPAPEAPTASPEPVAAEQEPVDAAEPEAAPVKKPRIIDVAPFTPEADFPASPAALVAAYRARSFSVDQGAAAAPLLEKLTALRDSMAARRRNPTTPPAPD